MILSDHQIRTMFRELGCTEARGFLWDAQYRTCSLAWVEKSWEAYVKSLGDELTETATIRGTLRRVPLYLKDAYDCDNHALCNMAHATKGHALSVARTGRYAGVGLAKGWVSYIADPRHTNGFRHGRHAINWFIDHHRKIQFFEPGDGTVQYLTKSEIHSVNTYFAA